MRLVRLAGLDSHVLSTLLFRGWSVIAGGASVLLVPLCLTPDQQGYYYTFASILALQIFFELGMGQVVIQIVAHEAVHLRQGSDGRYEGSEESLARLAQLRALMRRWYLPAAFLFAAIVCATGMLFFRDGGLRWSQWVPAWTLLVGASAVNLFLSWKLAMVEGFALVRDIAQLRLRQSIAGYLLMWGGLVAGAGLWVAAVVPLIAAMATFYWLRVGSARAILGIESPRPPEHPVSWTRDILPFQWRIAVSWISGYFIFHLFTPLMFRQQGAAEAGRLGLAMTVFSAISTIGMSWVNAKAPNFSMLIARRDSEALLPLFKGLVWRSLAITAAVAAAIVAGAAVCTLVGLPLMSRIAPLPVLACLAWVTVVNCAIFASAVFMRAHREEPMLPVSIAGGALTGLAAWFGSTHGATPMMAGYALVTTFVCLPWTLWILRRYLARHRPQNVAELPSPTATGY